MNKTVNSLCAFAVITVISFALTHCASNSQNQPKPQQGTGNQDAALPASSAGKSCSGAAIAAGSSTTGKIDGFGLKIATTLGSNQYGTQKSFCELLVASGRKSLIVQLVGYDCIECREHATKVRNQVSANNQIAHYMVFIDNPSSQNWNTADYKSFISKYGPGASIGWDVSQYLWKNFNTGKTSTEYKAFVMNGNLDGMVISQMDATQTARIGPAAVQLAASSTGASSTTTKTSTQP